MKKKNTSTVAIVGAGPAGAMCAYELARAGVDVALFDHKAPWEKPCGGMLSQRVFDEFPVMREYPYPKMDFSSMTTISQRGDVVTRKLNSPLSSVSRKDLGEYLLGVAIKAGTRFIKKKVSSIKKCGGGWSVSTDGFDHYSEILVGADGVNGISAKTTGLSIPGVVKVLVCGYSLRGVDDTRCVLSFFDGIGYLWSCPRPYDLGIGAGYFYSRAPLNNKKLFTMIDAYIKKYFPESLISDKWNYWVNMAHDPSAYDVKRSGDNWVIIGDACGDIDPLTGEGIYYAMKSSQAAAKSIIGKADFFECWSGDCGFTLKQKASVLKKLIEAEKATCSASAGAFYYHMLSKSVWE